MNFSSEWVKDRWRSAKAYQQEYNEITGSNVSSKEFYKNKNPLSQITKKYIVTIEMSYKKSGYEFFIPQESFTIYAIDSPENKNYIENNTTEAVASLFRGKAINFVSQHAKVTARGIEIETANLKDVDFNKLKTNNMYYKNVPKIKVCKKYGDSTPNVNEYNIDLWL